MHTVHALTHPTQNRPVTVHQQFTLYAPVSPPAPSAKAVAAWQAAIEAALTMVATTKHRFTMDDVREELARSAPTVTPPHVNALGAALRAYATTHGTIHNTHRHTASRRPAAKGRTLPIWESSLVTPQ